MKNAILLAAAMALLAAPAVAGPNGSVVGDYVEARMAEVFAGGCIMGSEAETTGRQALLAWRIAEGTFAGVRLDGLAVVAAVAGDRNLGIREIGGEAPDTVRAAVLVDERATPAQREALVALVRELSKGLIDEVVEVKAAPISFTRDDQEFRVSAGEATLAVATELTHDPSCGAMQWFHPLATVTQASVGLTKAQVYTGRSLGTRWSQVEKRSAFFGTFAY